VQVQLAKIFREIGDLFQIQDDVLDLYGDKKRDQAGSDIKEGKVSYLVVQHLKNRPEDHNFVLDVLKKPRESTTDHDVQSLIKDFEEKGTLDLVLKSIEQKKQAIFRQSPLIVKDFVESFVEEVLSPVAHLFLRPRRVD
jgi:geranylgeranyl diphosphate synthase type I